MKKRRERKARLIISIAIYFLLTSAILALYITLNSHVQFCSNNAELCSSNTLLLGESEYLTKIIWSFAFRVKIPGSYCCDDQVFTAIITKSYIYIHIYIYKVSLLLCQ